MKAALVFAGFVLCVCSSGSVILNYTNQAGWGGVCAKSESKAQSPIDVITPSKSSNLSESLSLPAGAKIAALTYDDTNNTIKYSIGGSLKFIVPMFNKTSTLDSIHFHWSQSDTTGSEHAVDGVKFAAETHLVTTYDDNGTTKYVVVNRFYTSGAENAAIKSLLEKKDIASFNLTALYPSSIKTILTYEGSLTTPDCDETVHWIIVPEALTMSADQLTSLRAYTQQDLAKTAIVSNVRDPQALNERPITKYSSSTSVMYSLVLIVAVAIKMLF